MKGKVLVIAIILIGTSSCASNKDKYEYSYESYKVEYNSSRTLRFIQEAKNSDYYCVDEFYYQDNTYSDNINIDIFIPDKFNDKPVSFIGRKKGDIPVDYRGVYRHDSLSSKNSFHFAIIVDSAFPSDANISINFRIGANVKGIELDAFNVIKNSIVIYNNAEHIFYYDDENICQRNFNKFYSHVKVNFEVSEKNKTIYSKNQELYDYKTNDKIMGKVEQIRLEPNRWAECIMEEQRWKRNY